MYKVIKSASSMDFVKSVELNEPFTIDITFNFIDVSSIASANYSDESKKVKKRIPSVTHPESPKGEHISDDQLDMYNNFLKNVYREIIHKSGITCTGYGSENSPYSCYIEFKSLKNNQVRKIRFKVLNHKGNSIDKLIVKEFDKSGLIAYRILDNIVIGRNKKFKNSISAFEGICKILDYIARQNKDI